MPSDKQILACRVSNETYEKVKELTSGDNPPYKSVSEYILSLINADLALRKTNGKVTKEELLALLEDEEIISKIAHALRARGFV